MTDTRTPSNTTPPDSDQPGLDPPESNPSAVQHPRPVGRWFQKRWLQKRWLRRTLVVALVLGVVLATASFIADQTLASAIEQRAGNRSLDFDDYVPAPLGEDVVNASEYLEAAARISHGHTQLGSVVTGRTPKDLAELQERVRSLLQTGERPSAEDVESFRSVVARHDLLLDILERAFDTAVEAHFAANYQDPIQEILIPNLLIRLQYSHLLWARGEVALADGRTDDAWDDAGKIFRMAHWHGEEMPTLIHALIGRAIASRGFELVQRASTTGPPSAATRARILEEAHRSNPRALFHRAFGAEQAGNAETILEAQALEGTGLSFPNWLLGWPLSPIEIYRRLNAAAYVEHASRRFEHCEQTTHAQDASAMDALEPPGWAHIARLLIFDCTSTSHKRDMWIAQLDMLDLAMELEAVRESTGEYPQTLDGLESASAVDPFSGEGYRYRRDGGGYVLYSLSVNGVDDGGARPGINERERLDFEQGDLPWIVASHSP